MIPIEKLRVGNKVLLTGNEGLCHEIIITVNNIHNASISSKLFPIPITEKLLIERCGMAGNEGIQSILTAEDRINIYRKFLPSGAYVFQYKGIKIELEGLHHLQNIVFFIAGIELPIK